MSINPFPRYVPDLPQKLPCDGLCLRMYIYCLSNAFTIFSHHILKIVNCLDEYKFGYEMTLPFSGEHYESVHQAMMSLISELEEHDYHAPKFRKLLKRIATDARQFVNLFLCPRYTNFRC